MKYLTLFFISFILFSCNNRNNKDLKQIENKQIEDKKESKNKVLGFLYKIEHNGATTYLYGVNHTYDRIPILDEKTLNALKNSEMLLIEFDFMNGENFYPFVKKYRMGKKPLKDVIPKDLYKKVIAGKSNSVIDAINKLSVHGVFVEKRIKIMTKLGYTSKLSFYSKILKMAYKLKKKVISFHEAEEYFKLLSKRMSDKTMIEKLKELLETPPAVIKQNLDNIKTAWESGNLGDFQKFDKQLFYSKEGKKVIKEIAREDIEFIIENCLSKSKNCFYARSATILTAEKENMIKELKKKGYKVTRIK